MDLDESITIATPEGLELRLQLAGLGSRFIAGAVDLTIMLVLLGVLALIAGPVTGLSSGVSGVVYVIGAFVILLFYPILFEVLAHGQTPGKRMSHLRVLRDSGAPVDLPASAIRNLMRLIDGPLLLYMPSIVSIAVTRRNQRPGDIAAGTIVTREHPAAKPARKARGGSCRRGRVVSRSGVLSGSLGYERGHSAGGRRGAAIPRASREPRARRAAGARRSARRRAAPEGELRSVGPRARAVSRGA